MCLEVGIPIITVAIVQHKLLFINFIVLGEGFLNFENSTRDNGREPSHLSLKLCALSMNLKRKYSGRGLIISRDVNTKRHDLNRTNVLIEVNY